jgi:hypothetical protein
MKATMKEAAQPAPKRRTTMTDTTLKTQGCSCGSNCTPRFERLVNGM